MDEFKSIKEYRTFLHSMARQVENPEHGFFGPDSIAWRVNREGVLGLGAMRALFMQIAHPKVAQGVADHSNFKQESINRAIKTLRSQQTIVFGTCEEAIISLLNIYARHTKVNGYLTGANGESEIDKYSGNDPFLQFWVMATLIDTVIRTHSSLFGDLNDLELDQLYQESIYFAKLFGIPPKLMPATLADFNLWMDNFISSNEIKVSVTAKEIATSLLTLPFPIFWPANYILAAGSLPPKLRKEFGLKWNKPLENLYSFGVRAIKIIAWFLPVRFRTTPTYWRAMKRTKSK